MVNKQAWLTLHVAAFMLCQQMAIAQLVRQAARRPDMGSQKEHDPMMRNAGKNDGFSPEDDLQNFSHMELAAMGLDADVDAGVTESDSVPRFADCTCDDGPGPTWNGGDDLCCACRCLNDNPSRGSQCPSESNNNLWTDDPVWYMSRILADDPEKAFCRRNTQQQLPRPLVGGAGGLHRGIRDGGPMLPSLPPPTVLSGSGVKVYIASDFVGSSLSSNSNISGQFERQEGRDVDVWNESLEAARTQGIDNNQKWAVGGMGTMLIQNKWTSVTGNVIAKSNWGTVIASIIKEK
jgi:hypothetical protein